MKDNIYKGTWIILKYFFAEDIGTTWITVKKEEPIRITYVLIGPLFIIFSIFISIYLALDFFKITKPIKWLFSAKGDKD